MNTNTPTFFDTVEDIIRNAPKLSDILKNADSYWAHVHPRSPPERFEEHYDRVNKYFAALCRANRLDPVIDGLVSAYIQAYFPKSDPGQTGNFVKRLFVHTAVFHDFGKINPNFQGHPKKMNNPLFRPDPKNPLKSQHSKQGAYLFITRHFQEAASFPFLGSPVEQRQLFLTALLFSYPIFKHHATGLLRPDGKGIKFEPEELSVLKSYLGHYGFSVHPHISGPSMEPKNLNEKFFDWIFVENRIQLDFSFFALLRLNFSLLTAADYIATGEYTNQYVLDDFGIFSPEKRQALIDAARQTQPYNSRAYRLSESGYALQHPTVPNGDNLNLLRTEMAVEMLQTLRAHTDKRLFYLEAPTGGGKTNLSMLAVAELMRQNPELNKVFYVFPFTTLITQTHKSVRETLGLPDDDIALLHSKAGFQTLSEKNKNQTDETEESLEDGLYGHRKREFIQNQFALYPFTLVTHVRFFDILKSNGKEDSYLMHRLANSVVVLDELQSYNPKHWDKMLYLLDQYGRWFNIRFVLMSATLPRLDRIEAVQKAAQKLPEFVDLLPDPRRYFTNPNFRNRVTFRFDLTENGRVITPDELADTVLEKSQARAAAHHGRVFTIIEFIFKKTATEFKDLLQSKSPFFDTVFVLSGTILEHRRRQIIYFLKKNRQASNQKVLLITTQVVEAGVDIDMDLGFKNVSLIDSDEQLAGRVNRNIDKENCEVYLFNLNKAEVLHAGDERFKVSREMLTTDQGFHREILESKNFARLYERVFEKIDRKNESALIESFTNTYLPAFHKLDFPEIHRKFKLIEQETISVFVPLTLPVYISDATGKPEALFSPFELDFLTANEAFSAADEAVNGARVWQLFRRLESEPPAHFMEKKIGKKAIQGILGKFTFSMFSSPANRTRLIYFSDAEQSFENYVYLGHYQDVYTVEGGLNETILKNPDPIL